MTLSRLLIALPLAAALTSAASAQVQTPRIGLQSDAPIDLDAESCDAFQAEDRVVCTGDVVVAQGPALLTAQRMEIRFKPGTQEFSRIEGEGGMRYASGPDAISGETGVFDSATSTVTVTGDVVVVQGEQVITGERLVYNTATGALSFSAAPGGRVRGLFRPGADEAAAAPAPATGLRR